MRIKSLMMAALSLKGSYGPQLMGFGEVVEPLGHRTDEKEVRPL